MTEEELEEIRILACINMDLPTAAQKAGRLNG